MDAFVEWWKTLSPEIAGVLMAVTTAIIRVIYDHKETKALRIVLEALLCGALSLTVSYAISAAGWNLHWAVAAGGAIGYLGSNTVRFFAYNMITKELKN